MDTTEPIDRDIVAQVFLGIRGSEETQKKVQKRITWLESNIKDFPVLDIGCSEGILPILLGRKNIDVIGIDNNQDAIEYAKKLLSSEDPSIQKHIKYIHDDFFEFDFGLEKFQTVVIGEVIEHLINPKTMIEKAINLLVPNGLLIVTTPFGYFPSADHKSTFTLSAFLDLFRSKNISPVSLSVEDGYIRLLARNIKDDNVYWKKIDESVYSITEESILLSQKTLYGQIEQYRIKQIELRDRVNKLSEEKQLFKAELNDKIQTLTKENRLLKIDLDKNIKIAKELSNQIKILSKENQLLVLKTERFSFKVIEEFSKAFHPISFKTLLLPITVTKLFFSWANKKKQQSK